MESFNLRASKHTYATKRSSYQFQNILNIDLWIQKKKFHTLCFDGASKGNPREAGVGGYSLIPKEKNPQTTIGIWG